MDDIWEAHDAILGGSYTGIEKTITAVASCFHWSRMTNSIANWVRGCDICHRIKKQECETIWTSLGVTDSTGMS